MTVNYIQLTQDDGLNCYILKKNAVAPWILLYYTIILLYWILLLLYFQYYILQKMQLLGELGVANAEHAVVHLLHVHVGPLCAAQHHHRLLRNHHQSHPQGNVLSASYFNVILCLAAALSSQIWRHWLLWILFFTATEYRKRSRIKFFLFFVVVERFLSA